MPASPGGRPGDGVQFAIALLGGRLQVPGPHWCLLSLVAAYDDYARLASALRENRVLCRQQTDIRPVVGNVWRLPQSSNSPAFASCGGHH